VASLPAGAQITWPQVPQVVGALLRCPPAPARLVTSAGFEIDFPGPRETDRHGWPDCEPQVIGAAAAGNGFPTVLDHQPPRRGSGDRAPPPLPLGGGAISTTPFVANLTVLGNRAGYVFPFHSVGAQSWTVTEASALMLRDRPPAAAMGAAGRAAARRPAPPVVPTIVVIRHAARAADAAEPSTSVPQMIDTWFDLASGLPMVNCVRNPPSPYVGAARSWKVTAIRLPPVSGWRRPPPMPNRPPAWVAAFDLIEHCRLGRTGEMPIPDVLGLETFQGAVPTR
jgi:hypothetical protein